MKHFHVAMIAALIMICSVAESESPRNDQLVPNEARVALDRLHPGWKLAGISYENRQYCYKKDSPYQPTLVWGDFNGDGRRDYAAIVTYGWKTGVIILLATDQGYKPVEVFTTTRQGERPPELLDVGPEGMLLGIGRPRKMLHETVIMQYCEAASVAFVYANGNFRRVYSED